MKEEPKIGFLQHIVSHISFSCYSEQIAVDRASRRLVQCLKLLLIHSSLALDVPPGISLSMRQLPALGPPIVAKQTEVSRDDISCSSSNAKPDPKRHRERAHYDRTIVRQYFDRVQQQEGAAQYDQHDARLNAQ